MGATMTSYERCMAAFTWKTPDRVPVIPQNSDHAIYLAGYDMIEGSKDARKLAHALLEAREKFGYDCIMLGPDAAILAEALGCPTEYRVEDPPERSFSGAHGHPRPRQPRCRHRFQTDRKSVV